MPKREVEIPNRYGLHMRPAMEFMKLANQFASDVTVRVGGRTASGKSIMDLVQLSTEHGVLKGARIEIEAEGADAETCVERLAELVRTEFPKYDE